MNTFSTFWVSAFMVSFFFCQVAEGAQNPYEELRSVRSEFCAFKAFNILSMDLSIHEPDSALKNIEYIQTLAKEKNDKNFTCVYYETLGHFFSLQQDKVNELATTNHEKALAYAEDNGLDEQLVRQTFMFGNYYYTYVKYADAYRYFRQTLALIDKVGEANVTQIWKYYLVLARYFYVIKDYDTASELLQKVLIYNNRLTPRELFDTINSLGLIALYTGKIEKATGYFEKVLEKANAGLDSAWMGIAYGNIGNVHAENKAYDRAIDYFKLDYAYNSTPSGDLISALGSLKKMAELQFKLGDYNASLKNIDIYLDKIEKKPIRYESLVESYDLKAVLLEKLGINVGQLETLKEASKYTRLLATLNNSNSLEMAKLEEEKSNYNKFFKESKQYKKLSIFLVVTLIVALSSLLLLLYRKSKRSPKKEVIAPIDDIYCPIHILGDKRFHSDDSNKSIHINLELRQLLELNLLNNRSWEKFKLVYNQNFPSFFSDLMHSYPELTESDLRLLALINLDLSIKELADKLSVSIDAIKKAKQRLKKKLSGHVICE